MVIFENKPSTNTPINSANLNENFSKLNENKLDKSKIKNTYSTSNEESYSCNYVNGKVLWEGTPSNQNITLNDDIETYKSIEFILSSNANATFKTTQEINSPVKNQGYSLFIINCDNNGYIYINTRTIIIDDSNVLKTYDNRYGFSYIDASNKKIGDVGHINNIYIYKIIGYK